jgi:serine phosphatase RsbU (regulator of sigma subunit)
VQAVEEGAVVAAPPPSTILVVDDSPVNLQVLIRTLNGSGHRILAAKNGRTALEIARRARPDLVLLDVMMPDINGFEVCRALKADVDTQDTVVIFLSALGEVSDKVSGLRLGASDYITKPIQAEEVLARVANHLTRHYLEREVRRSRDKLDRELAGAARMQRLILPPAMPEHPAVSFAAYYQTSRHAGGDYYDVVPLGADRFGVLVADVSGHGAPAAIVMAMIRTAFHTHPEVQHDPPAVLHSINRHFRYLWESEMFATAVYAVLDAPRGTLSVSCAGHPPPMLIRPDHDVSPLPVQAVLPMLWMELGDVPCSEHTLRPGDRLAFYTDGITDRHAADETMYDPERLTAALATVGTLPPAAIVERLVADLDAFAGGHEPDDDQTLVVVGVDACVRR